eukprot:TRINITY_DN1411_c0_g1_i2.p1 TRINITY_DN1411_c0_g1~~TRINITY_DN1411_c0_g1_i2.p1  ORF type:complete len:191 (+),score=21.01 TRINITY_DN1411_c0_g1_i2:184-756(+)
MESEINFETKHPLQDAWTWWYDNPGRKTTQHSWGDHLKQVYTFNTVEDFWCLWNNIKGASDMPPGSDYHLFKQGIEPKWEDSANIKGGQWVVPIKRLQRENLTTMWLHLVLALIGSNFEDCDEIAGSVVSVRKTGDRVAIWTRNATNEVACKRIGQQLKDVLGITHAISYTAHEDAMKSKSGRSHTLYEL